jgi:hypothetical protein
MINAWRQTGLYLIGGTIVYLVEPPYTGRYVRWCERLGPYGPRLLDYPTPSVTKSVTKTPIYTA